MRTIGIDFTDPQRRYGVVVGLDSDPRLPVEPGHAAMLEAEERLLVLEQVGALWYQGIPRGWISGAGA